MFGLQIWLTQCNLQNFLQKMQKKENLFFMLNITYV